VPVGVDKRRAVAAPEGLVGLAADRGAGGASLCGDGVDLLGRADVERQRHSAPAEGVLDAAVLGERGAVPQRQHHVAGLKEDDVVVGLGAARPAQGLVETARAGQVAHAEGDHADSLSHATSMAHFVSPLRPGLAGGTSACARPTGDTVAMIGRLLVAFCAFAALAAPSTASATHEHEDAPHGITTQGAAAVTARHDLARFVFGA